MRIEFWNGKSEFWRRSFGTFQRRLSTILTTSKKRERKNSRAWMNSVAMPWQSQDEMLFQYFRRARLFFISVSFRLFSFSLSHFFFSFCLSVWFLSILLLLLLSIFSVCFQFFLGRMLVCLFEEFQHRRILYARMLLSFSLPVLKY